MEQSETTDISPINNSIPQNSEMSSDLEKIASTNSLSQADDIAPIGRNDVFGKDFRVKDAPLTALEFLRRHCRWSGVPRSEYTSFGGSTVVRRKFIVVSA